MPFPKKKKLIDLSQNIRTENEYVRYKERITGFNEAIDLCTKAVSVEMIAKLIASQDYRNKSKFNWEELSQEDKNDYYTDARAIHSAIVGGE